MLLVSTNRKEFHFRLYLKKRRLLMPKIKDRIKELRRVRADELLPNPKNWRMHPREQQDALRGVLAEVGMADAVLARELADGQLMLVDGHLRTDVAVDAEIPVLVLDVNEEEADKLLATIDPLAAMAEMNKEALGDLIGNVESTNAAVADMLESLAKASGMFERELNDDDTKGGNYEDGDEPAEDSEPPAIAGVRMVQLFLNETSIQEFQGITMRLSEEFATENITDTVMEALKREDNKLAVGS
jgi:hypothetical protein